MAPTTRGWLAATSDRFSGWMQSMPPETCSYTTDHELRVPMSDGVELCATLYRPTRDPLGTVLFLSPYGRDMGRLLVPRGIQVVVVSSRGTGGSEGDFEPGRDDAADAQAVVRWMRSEAWYTGSFVTMGASYLGLQQWMLLMDEPKDLRAAVISTGPHDMIEYTSGSGASRSMLVFWGSFMRRLLQKGGVGGILGFASIMWFLVREPKRLRPVYDHVPLLAGVDRHFGGDAPKWMRDLLLREPPIDDAHWQGMRTGVALERVSVPVLLTGGWYDVMLPQVTHQYERLRSRGCPVALTVGPWTHLGAGGRNSMAEELRFVQEHLRPSLGVRHRDSPVRVHITGAGEWREMPAWPPATEPQPWYLGAGATLSQATSASSPSTSGPGADESTFLYDPASPTPDVGSPGQFDQSPAPDDTALGGRTDVLAFTSQPLAHDIEVCGRVAIELHHVTSTPFADLLVRLSEVDAGGKRSRNIAETYLRLDPDRDPNAPLHLKLTDCAHRFRAGTRVRLLVAGGAHPLFLRNFGSGEAAGRETTLQPVRHTVSHRAGAESKLVLPVTMGLAPGN